MSDTTNQLPERQNDVLINIGLMMTALVLAGYFFHINTVLWNPMFGGSGRYVKVQDVHKLGHNAFYYMSEQKPFSGVAVQYLDEAAGTIALEKHFHTGMLKKKVINNPKTNLKAIEIEYVNENLTKASFWAPDGNFVSTENRPEAITAKVIELEYQLLYKADVL